MGLTVVQSFKEVHAKSACKLNLLLDVLLMRLLSLESPISNLAMAMLVAGAVVGVATGHPKATTGHPRATTGYPKATSALGVVYCQTEAEYSVAN